MKRILGFLIILIIIFSVFDAVFTYIGLEIFQVIEEGNPIADVVFEVLGNLNGVIFWFIITIIFMLIIWKYWEKSKIAPMGIVIIFAVKSGILMMHFDWLVQM